MSAQRGPSKIRPGIVGEEQFEAFCSFLDASARTPRIQLSIVDLGGITSPQAYRLLGEEVVGAAHRRAIVETQQLAREAGCECSWSYCRSLYTVVRFVEAP